MSGCFFTSSTGQFIFLVFQKGKTAKLLSLVIRLTVRLRSIMSPCFRGFALIVIVS